LQNGATWKVGVKSVPLFTREEVAEKKNVNDKEKREIRKMEELTGKTSPDGEIRSTMRGREKRASAFEKSNQNKSKGAGFGLQRWNKRADSSCLGKIRAGNQKTWN